MNTVKIKSGRRAKRSAYHHGDLRRGLLEAAEQLILERGVEGFTLREAARRAGVSPAAPAHHFGDARGLLTAVAILGYQEFADALEHADAAASGDPAGRLKSQASAYVRFALANPARFGLMFRQDLLDPDNNDLRTVSRRAYGVLEDAVRAATRIAPGAPLTAHGQGLLLALWSAVHGFSHLALGGKLPGPGVRSGQDAILQDLLPLLLEHLPPV